jgi:hypothetical protein
VATVVVVDLDVERLEVELITVVEVVAEVVVVEVELSGVVEDVAKVVVEEYVAGSTLTIVSLTVSVTKTLWMI